jgi:hypothetical protein
MHYRNGREAKNGDVVVQFTMDGAKVTSYGLLHDATPGNDYCNGRVVSLQATQEFACLIDCLHVDDLAEILKAAGLGKRP